MSARNEPAFPATIEPSEQSRAIGGKARHFPGMSLRDYFAAKAPAIPASFERKRWSEQQVIDKGNGNKHVVTVQVHESIAVYHARWAFEYADAMLAERSK